MVRLNSALAALVAVLFLVSANGWCGAEKPPDEVSSPAYLIGPEDVLEISVWRNAEISKVVTVRPDGRISLPLIGDVQAAGLTPEELKESIVNKLLEYQQSAIASVIVQEVNSYRVFVLGEVKTPGMYQLKNSTTVLQVLALAGGFTEYASKSRIILVRKNEGGEERVSLRFTDLINENGNKRIILMPGDTIFVP